MNTILLALMLAQAGPPAPAPTTVYTPPAMVTVINGYGQPVAHVTTAPSGALSIAAPNGAPVATVTPQGLILSPYSVPMGQLLPPIVPILPLR